jgi:hypothetical protein
MINQFFKVSLTCVLSKESQNVWELHNSILIRINVKECLSNGGVR